MGLGLAAHASGFPPGVRAVRQGAPAGGDGLSWVAAFDDLQRALAAAAADPSITEIWVAEGTYYPGPSDGPPNASFVFSNLALYGGFGGNEYERAQRRPSLRTCRLAVRYPSSAHSTEYGPIARLGTGALLDGFAVDATNPFPTGVTSGLRINGPSTVANSRVFGQLVLRMESGASLVVRRSEIDGDGAYGCPVYLQGVVTLIDSSVVAHNYRLTVAVRADDLRLVRSTVWARGDLGSLSVESLLAIDSGVAGVYGETAGCSVSTGYLVRSSITGSATYSGLVFGEVFARDSSFSGTGLDSTLGRGVYAENMTLVNCVLTGRGYHGLLEATRAAIADSVLRSEGSYRSAVRFAEASTITNSIICGETPVSGRLLEPSATLRGLVNYCCVVGWDGSLGGQGNIGDDPLLDGNLRPVPGSPCIDAGTPIPPTSLPYDLEGGCRVTDGNGDGLASIDIGAFEFRQCPANFDCSTGAPLLNAADLLYFLDRFQAGDPRTNCDRSTALPLLNVLDFNCFLNRFVAGCP
jgi:hypothetical protein